MGVFDNFVYKNGKIVDNGFVKWIHWGVPDEEGKERERKRENLEELKHCKPCTALSGCYFVKSKLPNNATKEGLLHPHCDCKIKEIAIPREQITASCPIEKFTEYIFSNNEKHLANGKIRLFKALGFSKDDSEYLKNEFDLQAKQKYLDGDYEIGKLDCFGQRINISIVVNSTKKKNITLITGWMIHPLGKITCNTPLGG